LLPFGLPRGRLPSPPAADVAVRFGAGEAEIAPGLDVRIGLEMDVARLGFELSLRSFKYLVIYQQMIH
jgi:hypothetical protein